MKQTFFILEKANIHSPAGASMKDALVSITVSGVVVPGSVQGYKLAGANGIQYVIEAGKKWRNILARFKWKEVKVLGLLNKASMTIIPQKLFPAGPNGSGLCMAEANLNRFRKFAGNAMGEAEELKLSQLQIT